MKNKIFFFLFFNLIFIFCFSEIQKIYNYKETSFQFEKPEYNTFIKDIPLDLKIYLQRTFTLSAYKHWLWVGLSTAILIPYDEPITEEAQRIGDKVGLSHETGNVIGLPFMELPKDLPSALYFIGDGATHITISASFLVFGLINDDNRALQTASQIAEGMITTGIITVQILKHTTGRTSPRANDYKDRWDFFPNQIDYHKNVSHYDAFPSGHLATSMMTVTVIAENYPEYWIVKPLGYSLMSLLAFQMLNNGVHWAGDYPLAIAIGYSQAKIITGRHKKIVEKEGKTSFLEKVYFFPMVYKDNFSLVVNYDF